MKNTYTIFFRFLAMFMTVLIIPVLFSWLIYQKMLAEYIEQIKQTNLALLVHTRDIVDSYISNIEWKVFLIGENKKLKELLTMNREQIITGNYKVKEFINELSTYFIFDQDMTTTCYIYVKKGELIITPETSFPFSLFNKNYVFDIHGDTVEGWHSLVAGQYYNGKFIPAVRIKSEIITHSESVPYIPYIQSLPVLSLNNEQEGVIVILISEKEIEKLITKFYIPPGGCAYIVDNSKNIITSVSGETVNPGALSIPEAEQEGIRIKKVNGKKNLTIFTTSEKNNWKYIVAIPYRYIDETLGFSTTMTRVLLGISLLFGLMLAFYLAYKNSSPLQKIINMMGDFFSQENSPGGYASLQGNVTQLITRSRSLQEELNKQSGFVQKIFFNRLIKGNFKNEEEMEAGLSFAKIEITSKKFLIFIISLPGYQNYEEEALLKEQQMTKVVIYKILEENIPVQFYIHEVDDGRVAVILSFSDITDPECIEMADNSIKKVQMKIRDIHQARFYISVSNPFSSLMETNRAMEEAIEALNFAGKDPSNVVIWFHQLSGKILDYYYSLELEMRFMNVIKAGDIKQAEGILDNIYQVNVGDLKLSKTKIEHLIMELHGTFVKLKNHIRMNAEAINQIREIKAYQSEEKAFRIIRQVAASVCNSINDRKKSHNTNLKNKIVEFLNINYADSQLSLYSVGARFGLTEAYLSFFFKEQTGGNFSTYLEKLRIDHASRLLLKTSSTINEIAAEVGYSSDRAFRRVFKKVKGTPPTSFRLQADAKKNTPTN